MRTLSATKAVVAALATRTEQLRVEVMDTGAVWRDLSTYAPEFDAVVSASWSENVDDPHVTAQVTVRREQNKLSLSPFMAASAFNRTFNPGSAYAPLIRLNAQFRISVAVVGIDQTPASGDWEIFFHGRIDDFDLAKGDSIEFGGRDLGGKLANTFIEEERVYGLAAVGGNPVSLRVWTPNTTYPLNTYVIPTEARRNVGGTPRFYKLTTAAGATGSTEPTWPTAGTVGDNGNTWTLQGATSPDVGFPVEKIIQNILDDWTPGVTLYVPPSTPNPAFNVTQFLQKRESVLEACRGLTLLYGGDVRYKWRPATVQFEFTLIDPDRAKVIPDYTFSNSDYEDISSLKSELSGIRNAWQGVYSDATDKDAGGRPKRKTILRTDSTSITNYDRLFAEIAEDESSQINAPTEMTRMLDAALADTKDPKIEQEVPLALGFPWVEINDLMRFSANDRHYSTDQDLAVFAYSHEATEGRLRTTISTRGKPCGGFERWHQVTTRQNESNLIQLFESASGTTFTATPIVGGVTLLVTVAPERASLGDEYEFHISQSVGFTPSSSTLVQTGRQRQCDVTNLIPGELYYTKVVPLTYDGVRVVRGYPSVEVSFIAGRAAAGHLNAEVVYGRLPLNGGFETQLSSSLPPDQWGFLPDPWTGFGANAAVWGSNVTLQTDANGVSGSKYVRFTSSGALRRFFSAYFDVTEGGIYALEYWFKPISGTGNVTITLELSDQNKGSAFRNNWSESVTTGVGTWRRGFRLFQVGVGQRFARAIVESDGTNTLSCDFDAFTLVRYDYPQEPVNAASLAGAWVNFGGVYAPAGYWKDINGMVHLRGLVKSGAIPSTIFTLATGYRPAANMNVYQIVVSNNGVGVVEIQSGGAVVAQAGNNTHFSLEGIKFRTDQ